MKLVVQVRLMPDAATAAVLSDTLAACNEAANLVSAVAHTRRDDKGKTPSNYDLRTLCYGQVRHLAPGSQASQHVIKKVADAYTTLRANLKAGTYGKKGSTRYARAAGRQVTFRPDAAQPFDQRNLSWDLDARTVSLLTTAGRIKNIPFTGGQSQLKELAAYPIKESDLLTRDGKWFLLATVDVPDTVPYEPNGFLGTDLGIENIAVTSDRTFHQGEKVKKVRKQYLNKRAELQKVATRSAKRKLKKRSRRESRFVADVNHCLSKKIVAEAQRTGCGIGLEKLTGIRERVRHRKPQRATFHSWAFAQLTVFICYKAARAGVPVIFVDPRYTSQQCSKCGHVDKKNRLNQKTFCCRSCGFAEHADYNAARNIERRATIVWAEVMQPRAA